MKRSILQFFLAAALTGLLFDGDAFGQAPTIVSMNPLERTAGAPGNFTLTLTGTNYCLDAGGGSTIDFNGSHTAVTPSATSSSTVIAASEVATQGIVNVTLTTNLAGCVQGGQTSNSVPFTINPPLVLDPTPFSKATLNYPYAEPILFSGGTGPYSFTIAGGALPPGLGLDPIDFQIVGTPTSAGSFSFTIRVVDSGGAQANVPYTIVVSQATVTVFAGTPQSVPVNSPFPVQFSVRVSDAKGSPLLSAPVTFTAPASGPSGTFSGSPVSFTDDGGVATAPPFSSNNFGGLYSVVASVAGTSSTAIFSLTNISFAPASIKATGGTPQSAQVGFTFPAPLQATVFDGTNKPVSNATVTFTLPGSGPSGVFPNAGTTATASSNASGIATSPLITANGLEGSYTVTAAVGGVAAAAAFSLTNTSGPSITTGQLPAAIVGSPYSAGVDASGGAGGYTFAIISGALPPGLTFNSSGAISGTPTTAGSFPILVQVTDSMKGNGAKELRILVVAALTITSTSPLPDAFVGQNYSQTFSAIGGQPTYTWSISGAPPPGLALNSTTGVLSGAPTATGAYSFTVQVTDFAQRTVTKSFTLTAAPAANAPAIQVSTNTLTFDGPAGGGPPSPQYVSLVASNQQPLTATITVDSGSPGSPAPPWLSANLESAVTPARLAIVTDQGGLPAGSYSGRVVVTYPGAQSQVINIAFSIKTASPQLTVSPGFLRFASNLGSPNSSATQNLLVGNSGGGGAIDFTVSVVAKSSWLTLTPLSGKTSVGGGVPLNVIANSQGLKIGAYFDKIRIESATGGTVDVPVSLFVSPNGAIIGVNPLGIRFDAREGNSLASQRDVSILNLGSGTVNWKAELQAGQAWFTLSSSTGQATPSAISKLTLTANPQTLKPGSYYGLIRFTDPQALNSPQYSVAVLKVAAATAPAEADLTPAGLFFTAPANGPNPATQTLRVFVNSDSAISFQAAASTSDRAPWLSIDKANGSAFTQGPGQIVVSINTTGLKPGVYYGEISVSLSTTKIRSANITLVVLPQGSTPSVSDKQHSATNCTPAKLAVTSSSLTNAFASPAGWPTPLLVRLTDDCSNPAVGAHVVATFSNGDPPLALSLTDPAGALYSGTWAPGKISSQMTVTLIGLSQGLASATAKMTGTIDANPAPALNPNGITNNLNPTAAGAALAPGTVAQIYGGSLAPSTQEPGVVPLPKVVNDTTVLIGLVQAPLYYVSDGQVNAQIPTELQPDRQYSVLVSSGAAFTLPDTITISSVSPGLTSFAQHGDYSRITSESPIVPGESITLYLVGMGATDQTVASGVASPGSPPAQVITKPTVTIGGKQASVSFAGLSPGAVGLYQVNVQTPADLASGDTSVVVTQGDTSSNSVTLPVR